MKRLLVAWLAVGLLAVGVYAGGDQAIGEDQAINPMDRLEKAFALIQSGDHREALAELTWCYDQGAEIDPTFVGVRNTYVVDTMALLGKRYPPAIEALRARRDAAMVKVGDPPQISLAFFDVVALTQALGEPELAEELIQRCGEKHGIKKFATSVLTSKKVSRRTDISAKDVQDAETIRLGAKLRAVQAELAKMNERIAAYEAKTKRLYQEKTAIEEEIAEVLRGPVDLKEMAQLSWLSRHEEKIRFELYECKKQLSTLTEKMQQLTLDMKRLEEELAKRT